MIGGRVSEALKTDAFLVEKINSYLKQCLRSGKGKIVDVDDYVLGMTGGALE